MIDTVSKAAKFEVQEKRFDDKQPQRKKQLE